MRWVSGRRRMKQQGVQYEPGDRTCEGQWGSWEEDRRRREEIEEGERSPAEPGIHT